MGDIRVFYDVTETQVQVLAVVSKAEAQAWLDEQGTAAPKGTEGGSFLIQRCRSCPRSRGVTENRRGDDALDKN